MVQWLSLPGSNGHWVNSTNAITNFDVAAGEDFTIAAWIRPTTAGTFDIAAATGPTLGAATGLWIRAANATANKPESSATDADSSATATASNTLTVDDWNHVVLRLQRSDNTLKIFVNGTERGSADATGIGAVAADTHIGVGAQANTSGNFPGDIISVEFYVDAATDGEISTAAAADPGTKLSGPTGTAGIFDAADFNVGDSDAATAADAQGNTWTINGASSEIQTDSTPQNLLLLGVG